MSAALPIDPALKGKHLFIEHLADLLEEMDSGRTPVHAIAYRLYARRLREATAGYPERQLAARLATSHPAVAETLANRCFDNHGSLPGAQAEKARPVMKALLRRLMEGE